MRPLRIIFAGGGTGGHLYPALAIAQAVERQVAPRSCDIMLVGTKRGIEYRRRDSLGYPLVTIPVRGFTRSFTLKNLLFPFALVWAMYRANIILAKFQPDLVIGTGGYVSGPVLSRATARNIPTAIQEQNSYPGYTTRKLAGQVDRVFIAFEEASKMMRPKNAPIVCANPIRAGIGATTRDAALTQLKLDPSKNTILILGGSQGAQSINNAVLAGLDGLPSDTQVLWQTGQREFDSITEKLGDKYPAVRAFAFSNDMAALYASADIAIARAGALTIEELKQTTTPAILIPFPRAAGDHQTKNAQSVVERGGAVMIEDATIKSGAKNILNVACDILNGQTETMRTALRKWKHEQSEPAADFIARHLLQLLEQRSEQG